jgi:hypothetical protein
MKLTPRRSRNNGTRTKEWRWLIMCGPQIRASARLLPGPSSAITLDFLVCDLSVPATLLGYGARGYCPTMFGEIARRRLAVRGGRLRPAKHAAELDTDRILRQLPPVDQLIRKFGDLALVEFAVVGLKCTACGHRGASALMGRPSEPGARGSGTGWRRHVRRSAPTVQDNQRSIASVVASVGGDRGVMRTVADAPSASLPHSHPDDISSWLSGVSARLRKAWAAHRPERSWRT